MTSPLIEAIKKDRENWTWTKVNANELGAYAGHTEGFVEVSDRDARRIARVPDLEAALIAAEELRRCCESAHELMSRHKREYALRMEANRMADFCQGTREISEALTAYRKATGADQ